MTMAKSAGARSRRKARRPVRADTTAAREAPAWIIPDAASGAPAFALLPYGDYRALVAAAEDAEDIAAAAAAQAAIANGEETFPIALVERIALRREHPVRVFREYRGLSQAALARAAAMRQGTVSAIEGGAKARLETMVRLARVLGVGVEELSAVPAARQRRR